MSMTGLEAFDSTVHKTNGWLKDIMDDLGWEDRKAAYLALRAVLQTLRDRLTVEEAAQFGAQLPMLVRGFYFEGWVPANKPAKLRRADFLQRIREGMSNQISEADPEQVARVVCKTITNRVSEGEVKDIQELLPKDLQELWTEYQLWTT